jgi:hypothetical protein
MTRKVLPLMAALCLAACGESGDSTSPDASEDSPDADSAATDAGGTATDADPAAADAGEESVTCGNTSCGADTECCIRDGEPVCAELDTCEGDVIQCQAPGDCPGDDICCRDQTGGTECTTAGQCAALICEGEEDCPGTQQCCPGEFSSTCAVSCDEEG